MHHSIDPVSAKRVSFGLVRMANLAFTAGQAAQKTDNFVTDKGGLFTARQAAQKWDAPPPQGRRGPFAVKPGAHRYQHFRHVAHNIDDIHDIVSHFIRVDDHDTPVLCHQRCLDVLETEPCMQFYIMP